MLAVVAAWRIKSSSGQLRGAGMTVLAIVLATVGMSVGTAILAFNAAIVNQQRGLARMLVSIQDGATLDQIAWQPDQTPSNDSPKLNSALRGVLTQEDVDTFASEINTRLGAFKFQPSSITDVARVRFIEKDLQRKRQLGPMIAERFSTEKVRVWPMEFANGWVIAVMLSPQGPHDASVLDNIGFVPVQATDGAEPVWLIAPEKMP